MKKFIPGILVAFILFPGVIQSGSPETFASRVVTTSGFSEDPEGIQYLHDVRYGPHERNVLDLWLVKSDKPTPLVLFIHGGGFQTGDKSKFPENDRNAFLLAGFSLQLK